MNWRDRATSVLENTPTPAPTKPPKPGFVGFGGTPPTRIPDKEPDWGYRAEEVEEFKNLLRDLGDLEGWSDDERLEIEDEFSRMAPVRFPAALQALRESVQDALAPWPDQPKERATLRLCVLTGRRSAEEIRREFRDSKPEAA